MNSDHQGAGFPKPVGPYSIFREAEGWIFLSGQIGLDPSTGKIVEGGVEAETWRILSNMEGIFLQAGIGWENCLKMTIYLVDMQDFEKVNEVYGRTLREPFPARSTVGVSALPKGARIEMEAIARKPAP
ncbi:MAG: Endoribonuclease L-PSP [Leptospirillum sp. Group II 'C75']|uniref:Rid family detoxifying hydrolase n=1 Tax=Leptospirillum sp. Group II 'CF-1' TaxID=1660083 RepID=UPI0000F0CB71|nr:Rid family detoxifying hydrolase [Leptospirillum sp. Group II 'CF-1']AKS23740.1 endoribonuclease L-PSP [Leptospirillum sp. Group II 'CF-1']EAY57188.1 MAG: Endoribonuclease L-PSP [Leptospirillum rubarum]EIJ77188.1 MAG: Endoribonuclease L-PSP [Leptospirillum sp. Group II 'C75']